MIEYFLIPTAYAGVITDATPISQVLISVLNFLLSVAGIVGIIGLVVAGVLYLTAGGDEGRIKLAKRATVASGIGLGIALGALVIVAQLGNLFR
ncbi:MAG: hypothetical protein WA082_01545 [Candidatus Moraniibacteriota bacterium]